MWFILGFFLLCDNPNKHPRISVEERQYLEMYGLTSKKNEVRLKHPHRLDLKLISDLFVTNRQISSVLSFHNFVKFETLHLNKRPMIT